MRKILIVSTVSRQFYLFEQGNIEVLKSLGYEVHAAANYSDYNDRLEELDIIKHHFDIERSPFSLKNSKAYKQLKEIMKSEKFEAVHCHSPMGGVIARLAAKSLGISPVIYTAHGFHFYKGAPLINWLLYYPVEKFMAKYTDILITINKEDNEIANKFKTNNIYIPGIGIDCSKYNQARKNRESKRVELGIPNDSIVLLTIGEMIKRKNYETALNAIARIKHKNFIYLICGNGKLEDHLKEVVEKLGIKEKVYFLGYRNDIPEICAASDIFIFPSYQEGLPVSMMECMASGLPIVCSSIRGNRDLVEDGIGGYLVEPTDINGFVEAINKLIENPELRYRMRNNNLSKVKMFDKERVKAQMRVIYQSIQ